MPLYFETSNTCGWKLRKPLKTGLAIRKGLIVTGDTFVDSAEKIAKIKKEFPEALACEMKAHS